MSNLKGKRLLILGGSRISCEIVRKAQEMGIYTMVTDWYPIEKSPAKQIADKAFMTSTSDISAMVNLIKREEVDGVITGFTDSVLPYYAQMCEKAGLPCYGTEEQFNILTNKRKYKDLCRKFDVPVVDEYKVYPDDLTDNKLDHIKYPVLVKPADNSGARGVSICQNKTELIEAYKIALDFSDSKEVLVERYIDGKEVTVFYLLQDGKVFLSGMGNRHIKHNQKDVIALPVAYTFPSVYLKDYNKNIAPKVKDMFQSIGMKNGMVFMQCLVENDECIVYDMGYRLTGSLEYKLMSKIGGYDPLEMLIRFALTGQMAEHSLEEIVDPYWDNYACNVSFLSKPGVIKEINGVDSIMKLPGVIDAVLAHREGEEIPNSAKGTLKQIILRVFATARNQEELEKVLNDIYNSLSVNSVEGENMLLEGFDAKESRGEVI